MTGSYERINYALRPGKNIERKMLCEAFRRLSHFARLDSFRYIGFGSTYFSDFTLFHKSLGIHNMVSIEKDAHHADRFNFNRPYRCIEMEWGHSNDVLPRLPWDVRTIVWLDYDSVLDDSVLTDVKFVTASASVPTALVITVNAHPAPYENDRVQLFRDQVGPGRVPADVSQESLGGWGTALVGRRIIDAEIQETLSDRNGGRLPGTRYVYRQLFNFRYQDDAKMVTVGGLLFDEGQSDTFARCGFDGLDFVRLDKEPCLIQIPSLTFKELRHLNSKLPTAGGLPDVAFLPEADRRTYGTIYRYFPAFVDAEF